MTHHYLLIVFVVILSCASRATDKLVTNPPSEEEAVVRVDPSQPLTNESCQRIFDKLKAAKGLLPSQKPILKIRRSLSDTSLAMALANNHTGVIEIEKRLISMCNEELGSEKVNGLAFILSHELAHFLKQHNVVHPIIAKNANPSDEITATTRMMIQNAPQQESQFEKLRKEFTLLSRQFKIRNNEAQADLEAGFISYLAGYNTLEGGQDFLDKAYTFYNLDTAGGRYPSLSERKSIVASAVKELDTLVNVFETANLLAMAGETEMSTRCYNRVLEDYQSADIWNNMGVVKLMNLEHLFSQKEVSFYFPVSMNLSPFADSKNFAIDENTDFDSLLLAESQKVMNNIDEVKSYFEKALEVNPLSYEAHLNLSIMEVLKYHVMMQFSSIYPLARDQFTFAQSYALKARKILLEHAPTNVKARADVLTMLGIIKGTAISLDSARSSFQKAIDIHPENVSALSNMRFLDGDEDLAIRQSMPILGSGFSTCDNVEKIRGRMSMIDFLQSDDIEWGAEIDVMLIKSRIGKDTLRLNCGTSGDIDVFNLSRIRGSEVMDRYTFCSTRDSYTASTNCGEIKKGQDLRDIEVAYGLDGVKVESENATLLRFRRSGSPRDEGEPLIIDGIIFELDKDVKIHQWAIYQTVNL